MLALRIASALAACALCAFAPSPARAAAHGFDNPPQLVSVALGYGLSSAYEDEGPSGDGFYARGEYILVPNDWVSPRAYAGTVLTFTDDHLLCGEAGVDCDVSAKIGFLGVKGRLTIPIPYVAPFLELGIGASIGAMRTRTLSIDEEMTGATYHVPVTIGLALGERHEFDLAFVYFFHPTERQFNGAVAVGFTFQVAGRPRE